MYYECIYVWQHVSNLDPFDSMLIPSPLLVTARFGWDSLPFGVRWKCEHFPRLKRTIVGLPCLNPGSFPWWIIRANKWFCYRDLKLGELVQNMVLRVFKREIENWWNHKIDQFVVERLPTGISRSARCVRRSHTLIAQMTNMKFYGANSLRTCTIGWGNWSGKVLRVDQREPAIVGLHPRLHYYNS